LKRPLRRTLNEREILKKKIHKGGKKKEFVYLSEGQRARNGGEKSGSLFICPQGKLSFKKKMPPNLLRHR